MPEPQRFLGYGRQSISQDDKEAVLAVLDSDYLTQGPRVEAFEEVLAAYCGARHAVAVSSGTAALHLAALASGLASGQVGLTQPNTFVASANCFLYAGASADFVDVNPDTLVMSPDAVRQKLNEDTRSGQQVAMLVPVAFGGLSAHMRELRSIAQDGIAVVEDACHALGGRDEDGYPVGSCRHADMTVFSFHPVKPITTAEGGAITTNDDALARRLRMLRTHGITREMLENESAEGLPWYYEQQMLGYNYRMSDLQAALGLSQLKRLDAFVHRRREIARRYDAAFRQHPRIHLFQAAPEQRRRSGHHLYVIGLDFAALGISRAQAMHWLRQRNIGTQVHYIPVHRQPFHERALHARGAQCHCPVAEDFYERCLSLPCFPDMTDAEVDWVAEQVLRLADGRPED